MALLQQRPQDAAAEQTDRPALHGHRTAKVIEIVCASTKSFEDAIQNGIADAAATTRGISGAHVQNMSIKCRDGEVAEYRVDLKLAFGVEHAAHA